eukprot:TRINITY_DN75149_c0_g1_i1.p1 TRINITY_DN75149_c0_g1~~TRINITY_DN75149_c0_g1_i1.p1  ORF type:complete len:449 (+),score=93.15 TRINITY_DN75149_c0_g1_i1:79-1425(+)
MTLLRSVVVRRALMRGSVGKVMSASASKWQHSAHIVVISRSAHFYKFGPTLSIGRRSSGIRSNGSISSPQNSSPSQGDIEASEIVKTDQADGLQAVPKVTEPAVRESNFVSADPINEILLRKSRAELEQRVGGVERYLPTKDPGAFLLPDSRLEPEERKWQKVFVAVPWIAFATMLTLPFLLVKVNLPWLQQRAEDERESSATRLASLAPLARVPDFSVVNFGQMPDVLERPFPTILLLFDPATYASKVFLPACRDLAMTLQATGLPVAVTALDMSAAPAPPDDFCWEYPRALAPHMQLILPRAKDGEAGVVDYDGRWSIHALAETARKLAGPQAPPVPPEELDRLEVALERHRDAIFELLFLTETSVKSKTKPPLWRRALGLGASGKQVEEEEAALSAVAVAAAAEARSLEAAFAGGLEAATQTCEAALRHLRGDDCTTHLAASPAQ